MLDLTYGIDHERVDDALAWAEHAYHACDVCPLDCRVDRHSGELGRCGLGASGRVYKEYLHLGEERALLPSHTIYMTGCNFRCAFCSDWTEVTRPQALGVEVAPRTLAAQIAKRRRQGATNVNFVGGLPDVNVLYILQTLRHCPSDTHVVWNTNLWTTARAIEALNGIVGTWLVDFKFGNDRCAKKCAGVDGYLAGLTQRLSSLGGAANVVVRHLLMPGHLTCCTEPVIAWLAQHRPDVTVNLMTGYHPYALAGRAGPMGLPIPSDEVARGVALLHDVELEVMIDGEGIAP